MTKSQRVATVVAGEKGRSKGDGGKRYNCPFCSGVGKLETYTGGGWYCHRCAASGYVNLGDRARVDCDSGAEDAAGTPKMQRGAFQRANYPYDGLLYLEDRGFTEAEVATMNPHKCIAGYADYVFFPVCSPYSRIPVMFSGRRFRHQDDPPKWVHLPVEPGVGRSNLLWGAAKLPQYVETLCLCEGIFDAVRAPCSVALLGKSISVPQIDIIHQISPERVVLALDGDAVHHAWQQARRLATLTDLNVYVLPLPPGMDPCTFPLTSDYIQQKKERV